MGRATPLALCLLLLLAAAPRPGGALKAQVRPGGQECFGETVTAEEIASGGGETARIEGAFFVSNSAHPGTVAAQLYGPGGQLVWSQAQLEGEGHLNEAAVGAGTYKLCFRSQSRFDLVVDLVYLHLSHLRRPGAVHVPKGTADSRGKQLARQDHLVEVRQAVAVVGELVEVLGGEQRYLQRKLERHIQTCRSNRRRTLGYTLLEVAALVAVSLVNVGVVTRMFKFSGAGSRLLGRIVV